MSSRVKIVTDSASDLPTATTDELGIAVVPLTVRFDTEEFVDGVELSNDAFWQRVDASATLPSTAAPSPGAFEEAFRAAAEAGHDGVVCITLSSKLSATHQAALAGARAVADRIDVRVIDSGSCAIGEGLVCVEAAKAANVGASIEEIVSAVDELKSRVEIYAALDSIDHLRKGGRIGAAGAFFASVLAVKPIISVIDGEVRPEGRQRTRGRSLDHLVQRVIERSPVDHLAVAHSGAPDLEQFLERLAPVIDRDRILVSKIGPIVGTHGGPRLIAVCFTSLQKAVVPTP